MRLRLRVRTPLSGRHVESHDQESDRARGNDASIVRSGDSLSGSQSGEGVTSPISDVKFDGRNISWINYVTKPMKMKLECTGVIEGKNISGKAKAGFMGTYPFFGSKQ